MSDAFRAMPKLPQSLLYLLIAVSVSVAFYTLRSSVFLLQNVIPLFLLLPVRHWDIIPLSPLSVHFCSYLLQKVISAMLAHSKAHLLLPRLPLLLLVQSHEEMRPFLPD